MKVRKVAWQRESRFPTLSLPQKRAAVPPKEDGGKEKSGAPAATIRQCTGKKEENLHQVFMTQHFAKLDSPTMFTLSSASQTSI